MVSKAANNASYRRRARLSLKATNMKDIVDGGYVIDRLAGRGGGADPPRRHQPQRRPSHAAAAVRQHEQGH
jgi:hypothetical protein